jgi:hypothetical protein
MPMHATGQQPNSKDGRTVLCRVNGNPILPYGTEKPCLLVTNLMHIPYSRCTHMGTGMASWTHDKAIGHITLVRT